MTKTPTPDGSPCRHCAEPIFWDEICWVHENGFATCGTQITGGTRFDGKYTSITVNPDITTPPDATTAIPVEEDWS